MKRFVEQDTETTPALEQTSRSRNGSDHKPAKVKRVKKGHNLPRIRAVKSNTPGSSRKVDSKATPASDDYWTWDDAAKQYFHIESDTGSVYWYDDTELDSDEALGAESRERPPVLSSSPPRNCEQADSGCLL